MAYKSELRPFALPSQYGFQSFRSRLEARWAYYFDLIGMKWEYEPEGYRVLGHGYLPDFISRPGDFFVEIKPNRNELEAVKDDLRELARMTGKSVFGITGPPTLEPQWATHPDVADENTSDGAFCFYAFTRKGWTVPFYTNDHFDGFMDEDNECVARALALRFENGIAHP